MMEIKSCPATTCGRPFQLNTFTTESATSLKPGQIKCPHCGVAFAGKSNSLFLTHALSLDQERKFLAHRRDNENGVENLSPHKRTEVFWGELSACEHFVQIYNDDTAFMDTLESFIREGLLTGDAAIVIATESHLANLEARLIKNGIDVAAARLQDKYIPLIAEETLAKFMVNGWPNDGLFASTVMDLLARARRNGRKVRAFGEMVALLWAQGHSAATVRLEHLWNQLCSQQSFLLFCAYPRVGFTENASDSIAHVCTMHSKVIAA
ncbi:MAG: hypothetical protein JWQ21_762 [Herminiimonas sp.]|nr:hypothetical protein [Herminiimonas sp.]